MNTSTFGQRSTDLMKESETREVQQKEKVQVKRNNLNKDQVLRN